MTITLSPTQADIQTVLKSFLLAILPAGTEVFEGQDNQVPEPHADNFVTMTAIARPRLATNIDTYIDVLFQGSITGSVLTVESVAFGSILPGSPVFGSGVILGTTITSLAGGTGGVGQYNISQAQNIGLEVMAAGTSAMLQKTEIIMQLDVHSDDVATSSDMAQIITTMFRDTYAVDFMTAINPLITPLYADDPKQVTFINAENNYETRWIVEAHMQADQTISGLPQQFADVVEIDVISVNATFPP